MTRLLRIALLPLIATGLASLASAGCSRGESAERPADELVVAMQDDALTLDPHEAADAASMRIIENIYSTLVRYAAEYGEVEPDLAERHTISEDGLTYTFHLREGVRFHTSARHLAAEDVSYSIQRIREKGIRADHFAPVEAVETPDEQTVIFRLREPFAPFLLYLANPMNAIVDRQVVQASAGSLKSADAGTGPFRLAEWKRGQHAILEKHPHYYAGGEPHLKRITFRPMPDETARTTALRKREVDLVLDIAPKDLPLLEGVDHLRIEAARPGTFWEYLGLNTARKPFDDPRVRQAIAWAVDRRQLNQVVKLGRATVLDGGHIRPGYWGHADLHVYPRRDLDRARQLLREAGYENGFSARLKVGSSFPYQVDAAQVVKQQLRDIGIDIEIQSLESGLFFAALGGGDFDMTLVGWVGFVDPDEWMYDIFHTRGKFNQQRYSSPALDALLERGRRTMDRAERQRIYAEAQSIVATEAPMVFLYLNDQTSAFLTDVQGYRVHPTATTLWLRDTRITR